MNVPGSTAVFNCKWVILSALLLAESFRCATGMPTIIQNDVVRKMEGLPILGRGYSITTNSFQGTCLEVNGTIVVNKHYDYDCEFCILHFAF